MTFEKPQAGKTYTPDDSIVPMSDGLPRRVTQVDERDDRFIVYYTTDTGRGHQSDNLWTRWMNSTGATPSEPK